MKSKVIIFILVNLFLIIGLFYISFTFHNHLLKARNKKTESIMTFLNRGDNKLTFESIVLGLTFGLVYGFMDNFSMWMGLDTFKEYLPGGLLTKGALGNTYSDFIGATVGTFISVMAADYLDYDGGSEPIWLNTIGIVIGCLLGMTAGKLITGKN